MVGCVRAGSSLQCGSGPVHAWDASVGKLCCLCAACGRGAVGQSLLVALEQRPAQADLLALRGPASA